MELPNVIILFNPTSKPVKIFDLTIKPGTALDVKSTFPRLDADQWVALATSDGLKDKLKDRSLILSYTDRRRGPSPPKPIETSAPFPRRGLAIPRGKVQQSDFIEKLQAEFSGDSILEAPEADIAKNTSDMINNIDFDGFDDPLAE